MLLLINAIQEKYPDTGQYLFKSCGVKWIVVMKKVVGTITNQSRLPVNYPCRHFAKYRANKLEVVDIINKFDPNITIGKISNSFYKNNTVEYVKGNIVTSDSFDPDINKVCANGIHFYESVEPAFYFELEKVENGQAKLEGYFIDEKIHGNWFHWYDNGEKHFEGKYINGKKNGKWSAWYENGQKKEEGEFLNGEKHGRFVKWYASGQKFLEMEFLNGRRHGKWIQLYENGQVNSEGEYIDGEKNGKWTWWYSDGQKIDQKQYGKLTN